MRREDVIAMFKEHFPGYTVLAIGGPTSDTAVVERQREGDDMTSALSEAREYVRGAMDEAEELADKRIAELEASLSLARLAHSTAEARVMELKEELDKVVK